jgi:lipid-A-disaccharide synthase
MKLYLVAGELSGDFIGSKIINNIKVSNPEIELMGIGGKKMLDAGLKRSLFNMEDISLFGLFEILPHIFKLKQLINKTVQDILKHKPKVLVTIDSPGFCFRVVEKIKKFAPEIIRIHIVAPSVWAYKPERAIKVADLYNHLLTLLPFEPPLFEKYGLKSSFIGHPIFEQDLSATSLQIDEFKANNQIVGDSIALTPGSRVSEIKQHLPVFAQAIIDAGLSSVRCIIVLGDDKHKKLIDKLIKKYSLNYFTTDQKVLAFKSAKLVLAKSGTNTLEIAACNKAMIVGYKMNILTWWWLSRLINIKYASLVNIVSNSEILPELIQDKFTVSNLSAKLKELFNDDKAMQNQVNKSLKVVNQMGFNQASKPSLVAANIILTYF